VNLHDVYEGNIHGKPAFELFESDKEEDLNTFQLIVQMEFFDGTKSERFVSPTFNLSL
jgi:hypothetical protein